MAIGDSSSVVISECYDLTDSIAGPYGDTAGLEGASSCVVEEFLSAETRTQPPVDSDLSLKRRATRRLDVSNCYGFVEATACEVSYFNARKIIVTASSEPLLLVRV